jgi:hypothetical protein
MRGTSWGKGQKFLKCIMTDDRARCTVPGTPFAPMGQDFSAPKPSSQGSIAEKLQLDGHGPLPRRQGAPANGEDGRSSGDTRDRPPIRDEWRVGADDTSRCLLPWGECNGGSCGNWGDGSSRFKEIEFLSLIRVTPYTQVQGTESKIFFRFEDYLGASFGGITATNSPSRARQGP